MHSGTLSAVGLNESMQEDVILKLAFNDEQQDALKTEYEMYRLLRSKGVVKGIATVLSFFGDTEEDGPSALVLLYAGVSPSVKLSWFCQCLSGGFFDAKCSCQGTFPLKT